MHNELEALGGFAQTTPTTIWGWIKLLFAPDEREAVDAYLSTSVDVFELEARMRALARKGIL